MLRYGIPAYRLPRPVLRAEIQAIVDLGVQIRCGQAIGDSLPWRTLIAEHDAVYLAVGAHHSLPLDVEGEDFLGVVGAVEFLRQVNMGRRPHVGRHPVIVGGGNSAVDAARTVARLGAEKVTILYRRRREDMPAQKEEIRAALDEGIDLRELVAPARIMGHNGRVSQMICRQMTLGDFDSGGRRRPIPLPGAEFTLTVDQVIAAVGQRPVLGFLEDRDGTGVNVTDEGLILVTHRSSTRVGPTMVFAGGDAVTGPSTVAWAISAGRRAAREIDDALRKRKGDPPYVEPELGIEIPSQVDEETKETPRCPALEADAAERVRSFMEVERGLPPEGARAEASRCLRCDVKQVS
jgi:NADH-quinone oxidoreductase subunit F